MSIGASEQSVVEAVPKGLFIGGEWRDASGGGTLAVEDPATGHTLCEVAAATPVEARAGLAAACAVQAVWAAHPPRERGEILRRAYEEMTERADELALLMTLEMGKALAESKAEIAYASEFFRWNAEEAVRIDGRFATAPNGAGRLLTMKQPVGPCLLITPWNFPAAMGTRKIGPAIAAGCTMVVKPAKLTPLSMLALAQILERAGLPKGVLNVVTAKSASAVTGPLIEDPRLRKLSFTGSTEVGRKLIEQSAPNVLKLSMELGGNAPFIVFEDADLDAAVEGAMVAKLRNIGEACTAANRFHVAAPIADEFADRLAAAMRELNIGRGTEDGVDIGPLVDEDTRGKVTELVNDAIKQGAQALIGGEDVRSGGHGSMVDGDADDGAAGRLDGAGHFYAPTVLKGVAPGSRVLTEEIFGPVAPVIAFDSEADAIAAANDTEFGLVAYVYTRDFKRALRVCEALETGMVGLNQGIVSNPAAPFGGVKQSGFGREGGYEGIEEYLETKYVAVNMD